MAVSRKATLLFAALGAIVAVCYGMATPANAIPPRLTQMTKPLGIQYYLRAQSDEQVADDVARVKTLGKTFGMVRIEIYIEDWADPASHTRVTNQVVFCASALQEKESYLLLLLGSSDYAASDLNGRYATCCRELAAALWSAGCTNVIFEIGNELDGTFPFRLEDPQGPAKYAALVNAAADAIASVSDLAVCSTGTRAPFGPGPDYVGPYDWSIQVMSQVNWDKVLFFGYHGYGLTPERISGIRSSYSADEVIAFMRDRLAYYAGTTSRDVLMTEMGWDGLKVNDATRAALQARLGLIHIRNKVESNVWFFDRYRQSAGEDDFRLPDAAYTNAGVISYWFAGNPKKSSNANTGNAQSVGVNVTNLSCETVGRRLPMDSTRNQIIVALWIPGSSSTQHANITIPSSYICATYFRMFGDYQLYMAPISGSQIAGIPVSEIPTILILRESHYWGDMTNGDGSYINPLGVHDITMTSGEVVTFQADAENLGCATWYNSGFDAVCVRLRGVDAEVNLFRDPSWLPDPEPTVHLPAYIKDTSVPLGGSTRLEWKMKAPTVTVPTTYHILLALYSPVSGNLRVTMGYYDITVNPTCALPDYAVTYLYASNPPKHPGDSFTCSWFVENVGQGDAALASVTSVYLSNDITLSPDDIHVADVVQQPLAAGGSQWGSATPTIPLGTPPGTYHIWVVLDRMGVIAESNESNNAVYGYLVTVLPLAPAADFAASPRTGVAPLPVMFTDISTNDPTSWAWDLGDGGTSTAQNLIHTYASAGSYTVSLTVTNAGGSDTETKNDYIAVSEPSLPVPVAEFSASPTGGSAPVVVSFTDLSTNAPTSWSWSFGDSGTSLEQNPSHEYTSVGTYTVTLTAANQFGADTEVKPAYITIWFADTPQGSWGLNEIIACVDAGIVKGYEGGTYLPTSPVSRDQMAVYIARAVAGGDANVPDPGCSEPPFTDVSCNQWARKYIQFCVSEGIVEGYEDGSYHPTEEVNRAQMAVYVARSVVSPHGEAGLAGYTPPSTPTFPDVTPDFWVYKHVEYCVEHGVVNGYEDGYYHPNTVVTRDQMAVYIARAFGLTQAIELHAAIQGPPDGSLAADMQIKVYAQGSSAVPLRTGAVSLDGNGRGVAGLSLPYGTYDVWGKVPTHLARRLSGWSFLAEGAPLDFGALLAGDLVNDNVVDQADVDYMESVWFTSDPIADINRDGTVNSLDFAILNGNWGKTGDP